MQRSALVLTLVLGACGTAPTTPQPSTAQPESQPARGQGMHGGKGMHDMEAMCPMRVQGTTAQAEEVPGGAALAFTTIGDVTELRRRAEHMADMHNQHHSELHMAQARAEDITAGTRIVFTPVDPAQLQALRQHIQHHAQRMMSSGTCPMMAAMSPDAPSEPPGEPSEPAGSDPAEHDAHHR